MEYLALYDDNDKLLNEKVARKNKLEIIDGKYFRIVIIFIENNNNEFLIQKVTKEKGDCFASTGGHVQYRVSSLDTARIEIEEELGIIITNSELKLLHTYKYPKAYQDVYYLKKNIDIKTLKLQDSEVDYVKWMDLESINRLIDEGMFRKGNIEPFKQLILKK